MAAKARKKVPMDLEAVRKAAPEFNAVVGVDASISNTGVSVYEPRMGMYPVRIRSVETIARGQDHFSRNGRMVESSDAIGARVPYNSLVLMEGPSYGSPGSSFHDLAGHWWRTYDRLVTGWSKVIVVPPGNLKKFATGSGAANKEAVMLAAVRRWPDLKIIDNNTSDAAVLMQMGRTLLGWADFDMPMVNMEAFDALDMVIPWKVEP